MNVAAWEVMEDGTLEQVTVTGRSVWPGSVRITRADGSQAVEYIRNIMSHATGERLSPKELV